MCFLVLFPTGKVGKFHSREEQLSHSEYIKSRLFNVDSHFQKDRQYVFYLLWKKEMRELSAMVFIPGQKSSFFILMSIVYLNCPYTIVFFLEFLLSILRVFIIRLISEVRFVPIIEFRNFSRVFDASVILSSICYRVFAKLLSSFCYRVFAIEYLLSSFCYVTALFCRVFVIEFLQSSFCYRVFVIVLLRYSVEFLLSSDCVVSLVYYMEFLQLIFFYRHLLCSVCNN